MKKTVFVLAALAMSTASFAQKSKIYSAKEYMSDGDMAKAVATINEAVNNEGTKTDGDAWFTRGEIYEKMAEKDPAALEESVKSYLKVVEVKPNFDKNVINGKLIRLGYKYYNDGVQAYQKTDYNAAINAFSQTLAIRDLEGGKRFASEKKFDTLSAQALKFQALSAYYAKNESLAQTALTKAKNNPIARDPYIYSTLIDLYSDKKDFDAAEKLITEAKGLYGKDPEIARQEMNFYSRTNKLSTLVQKMEEAVKSDPDNSLLQFNLGVLYSNLANPKNDRGDSLLAKPANAKELEAKAEMAYKMAIDADPSKADYVYNLGALYFNNASDLTNRMNAITGTSDEENRKYDALKALRTQEFTKSLPHFQKTYDLLSPKASSLTGDDFNTYRNTLLALQAIYEDLGQSEKSAMIAGKISELNKK